MPESSLTKDEVTQKYASALLEGRLKDALDLAVSYPQFQAELSQAATERFGALYVEPPVRRYIDVNGVEL